MLKVKKMFKNKGSSLVWALGAMLALSLIAAGFLAAGAGCYKEAVYSAQKQKAELLAQSGITYAKEQIESGGISPDSPITVYFDGETSGENCAEISFNTVDNTSLKITSSAECGGVTAKCGGIFEAEDGVWIFAGYTG